MSGEVQDAKRFFYRVLIFALVAAAVWFIGGVALYYWLPVRTEGSHIFLYDRRVRGIAQR